jgi:predicted nucleotidyltransferase
MMRIEELKKLKKQIERIAARNGISKVYVFGSVARGESGSTSDVDFLIELEQDQSALGIGAFQYETEQLLGIHVDVVPTFALREIEDRAFVKALEAEAVAI